MALFIPIYAIKRRYDHNERERPQRFESGDAHEELEAVHEERKRLQARIENLEPSSAPLDYELNLRLAKLPEESGAAAFPRAL